MANDTHPSWNWRAEGFQFQPSRHVTTRALKVHRVWGGTSSEMGNPVRAGVCFSLEEPRTRREAEGLFSVWEWGNSCMYLSTFDVLPGTTVFIGKAHPGDYYQSGLGAPGSQVFIQAADVQRGVRKISGPTMLLNDMGPYVVVPNSDPGKARSS